MEKICTICPRNCRVDRSSSVGFCGESNDIKIAKHSLFMWEEPIISGTKGSGAIFFSGCNLKCIYCQNYEISWQNAGKICSINDLVNIMKNLEQMGAHNINFVTPTHFTNQIIEALKIYIPKIPIVWNTSGYETVETIQKLKNYVDIYLTDLKYHSDALSTEYSGAKNYFDIASKAILEMRKNQPKDIIKDGIMQKGLIVRHLVLPTHTGDSVAVLNWIKENLGEQTFVSVMSQYTPCFKALKHKKLKRKLRKKEYERVLTHLVSLGFKNGFVQEMDSSSPDFIPDFKSEN